MNRSLVGQGGGQPTLAMASSLNNHGSWQCMRISSQPTKLNYAIILQISTNSGMCGHVQSLFKWHSLHVSCSPHAKIITTYSSSEAHSRITAASCIHGVMPSIDNCRLYSSKKWNQRRKRGGYTANTERQVHESVYVPSSQVCIQRGKTAVKILLHIMKE